MFLPKRCYFFLPSLVVLAGPTGSGKTLLLEHLHQKNLPVINLEKIASHSGSVFGNLTYNCGQPCQKDFDLQLELICKKYNSTPFVFTESEAPSIGKRKIPGWFYKHMQSGLTIYIDLPKSERIKIIESEYKKVDPALMCEAVERLAERLSADTIHQLKTYLKNNKFGEFADAVLEYYDQSAYYNSVREKAQIILSFEKFDSEKMTESIFQNLKAINSSVFSV